MVQNTRYQNLRMPFNLHIMVKRTRSYNVSVIEKEKITHLSYTIGMKTISISKFKKINKDNIV